MLRDHKGGVLGKDQGSLPKGSDVFFVSRTYPGRVGLRDFPESRTSDPKDYGIFEGLKKIHSQLECTVNGGKLEVLRNDAVAASMSLIVQSLWELDQN